MSGQTFPYQTVRDIDVQGKQILMRADYNVPLDDDGRVADDFRIEASLPTLKYLLERGAKLRERNYRCPMGEVDLIVDFEGCVVFVEVKLRGGDRFGRGAQAVDAPKQAHITRTAQWYLKRHRLTDARVRFDVVEVSDEGIRHLRAAFYARTR